MKYAMIKYTGLLIIAFSFSKAGAQDLKFPLLYKLVPVPVPGPVLKSLPTANLPKAYRLDSSLAKLLIKKENVSIFALPLDGMPCYVAIEPAGKILNAWKPGGIPDNAVAIPNALAIKPILPQSAPAFPPKK